MALPIITADQRLREKKGVKLVLLGKSGIGKTTQLKTLPEAVKLIDDNLADRPTLEDQRAKALLLARDPFRRKAALEEIQGTLARGPLSPDHCFRLAQLYRQAGDPDRAEQTLKTATQRALSPGSSLGIAQFAPAPSVLATTSPFWTGAQVVGPPSLAGQGMVPAPHSCSPTAI